MTKLNWQGECLISSSVSFLPVPEEEEGGGKEGFRCLSIVFLSPVRIDWMEVGGGRERDSEGKRMDERRF